MNNWHPSTGFVHIDTYSAMNGISRFLEEMERSGWRYSKAENISSLQYLAFDYLLIGTEHLDEWKRKVGQNLPFAEVITSFTFCFCLLMEVQIADIDGYSGIDISRFPPLVRHAPKVTILKNTQGNQLKKDSQA